MIATTDTPTAFQTDQGGQYTIRPANADEQHQGVPATAVAFHSATTGGFRFFANVDVTGTVARKVPVTGATGMRARFQAIDTGVAVQDGRTAIIGTEATFTADPDRPIVRGFAI